AHLFDDEARGRGDPSSHPSIIRPLLCLTRDEVEEYCRDHNLAFRIDRSNSSPDYTRNRVRLEVLPALRSINPRVVERIGRAAELMSGDQDALDIIAGARLDEARLAEREAGATGLAGALGVYRVSALLEQPCALRRRMIVEALGRARVDRARLGRKWEVTSSHVASVEGLLEKGMSGRRVTLPGGLEAWREFDALVLKSSLPTSRLAASDSGEREISCARPEACAGGLRLTLICDRPRELLEASLAEARRERERAGRDWMMAVLNAGSMPSRLVVRPRLTGERARVLGQSQIKKLKNLMIDHKIPSSLRAVWPVVATPDGRYIWSPGLPPALEFAAHDETSGLAILRASGISVPLSEVERSDTSE
ncbi:MAG TPA: tRNA lysidine(34) synthetase TilS, partial [Blastocatellia bacterium]|nr:tRNA lysidine(34) synthetase TilS [Blastocatellia bacterium]